MRHTFPLEFHVPKGAFKVPASRSSARHGVEQ